MNRTRKAALGKQISETYVHFRERSGVKSSIVATALKLDIPFDRVCEVLGFDPVKYANLFAA